MLTIVLITAGAAFLCVACSVWRATALLIADGAEEGSDKELLRLGTGLTAAFFLLQAVCFVAAGSMIGGWR